MGLWVIIVFGCVARGCGVGDCVTQHIAMQCCQCGIRARFGCPNVTFINHIAIGKT